MKYGIEIEGRLKGIPSLFVKVEEIDLIQYALRLYPNVGHINITDHNNEVDFDLSLLKDLTNIGYQVTLDRTKVDRPVPDHINVSLYMEATSFQYLKDTDEVKFNNDFHVRTSTKEAMIYTHPKGFEKDVDITKSVMAVFHDLVIMRNR